MNHNTITKWLIKYASLSFVIFSILLFGILAKYGTDISVNIAHVLVITFMATTVVGTMLGALFRFNKAFRGEHDICNSVGMYTGILISTLTLVLIVPSNRPRESAYRASCANNLLQMHKAMHFYRSSFGKNVNYMPHQGPVFFTCLLGHEESHPRTYEMKAPCYGNTGLFNCPSAGTPVESVVAGGGMPDYLGPKKHTPAENPSALDDNVPADTPIAADKKGNHGSAGGNVLFFSGKVLFLTGAEYEQALKQLEWGLLPKRDSTSAKQNDDTDPMAEQVKATSAADEKLKQANALMQNLQAGVKSGATGLKPKADRIDGLIGEAVASYDKIQEAYDKARVNIPGSLLESMKRAMEAKKVLLSLRKEMK